MTEDLGLLFIKKKLPMILDYIDKVNKLTLKETDLSRTFHACQIHNDQDACRLIDEKEKAVKEDKKEIEVMRKRIRW